MSNNKRIWTLVVLLAIVVALFGTFLFLKFEQPLSVAAINNTVSKSSTEYMEISSAKDIKENRVIVTDKFVGKIEAGSQVVAFGSDGSAYVVKKGAVLVSGMVINAKNSTSYSIYRIKEPEKSVSTN